MGSLLASVRAADRRSLLTGAVILLVGIVAVSALAFGSGTTKDLDVYLLAARRFADGGSVYGAQFGRSLTEPLPYTYPPVLAAALASVAWLPVAPLAVAWTILDLALLVWVVRVSYARGLDRVGRRWPILLAGLAAVLAVTAPVLSVFDLGQIGIVLMALVLADTLPRRTRLPRGVLVGTATAIKLVPGLFIAYWRSRTGGGRRRSPERRPSPSGSVPPCFDPMRHSSIGPASCSNRSGRATRQTWSTNPRADCCNGSGGRAPSRGR